MSPSATNAGDRRLPHPGERGIQIHVTLTGGESPRAKRVANAEIHFEERPLAGLRLVGFSIETGRDQSDLSVKLPAHVYSVAGERRRLELIQPRSETTPDAQIARAARLESALLDAYAEAVEAERSTAGTTRHDRASTPQARKSVADLVDKLGVVDTLLAVANECGSRSKKAGEQPAAELAAAWRQAGMQVAQTALRLEGSPADYQPPKREKK